MKGGVMGYGLWVMGDEWQVTSDKGMAPSSSPVGEELGIVDYGLWVMGDKLQVTSDK